MGWKPKGTNLRRLREQMELTLERLAELAEVDEKTIRNIESGRTLSCRAATLKAIAAVLDVEIEEIATREGPPQSPPQGRAPPSSGPRPPSRLDALVAIEEALGGEVRTLATPGGSAPELTARSLQDIITAYLPRSGARLWVSGKIARQHGVSRTEGAVLGTESGAGARFLVMKEIAPSEPLSLTAYTTEVAHTLALQESLRRGTVTLVLRVLVTRGERGRVVATDLGRGGWLARDVESAVWRGFHLYGSETLHPWTLVVEAVQPENAGLVSTLGPEGGPSPLAPEAEPCPAPPPRRAPKKRRSS
jgi:DNA-binding XRE family transcriptional regulator